MASKGYRTLVFGTKELAENLDWENLKPEIVENNLNLLAVTGVEDLL